MLGEQLHESRFFNREITVDASLGEGWIGVKAQDVETFCGRGQAVVQAQMRQANEPNHFALPVSWHIVAIPSCHEVNVNPGKAAMAALGAKGR